MTAAIAADAQPAIGITGANGFLGRCLVDWLSGHGHRIVAITRSPEASLGGKRGVEVELRTMGDIAEPDAWSGRLHDLDVVIHLAALAHQATGPGAPSAADYRRINVDGTVACAREAMASGARQFIFVSSIGAVAVRSEEPLAEETPPRPETAYGRSKREAEEALAEALADTPCAWTVVRPPLVYGPGNPGNLARFLAALRHGFPLPLGSIRNRRSFLFAGNLAAFVEVLIDHPSACDRVFHVADAEVLSTPEFLSAMAGAAGLRARFWPCPVVLLRIAGRLGTGISRLTRRPIPVDEVAVDRLCASLPVSLERARRDLGWTPPFSCLAGLAETFARNDDCVQTAD